MPACVSVVSVSVFFSLFLAVLHLYAKEPTRLNDTIEGSAITAFLEAECQVLASSTSLKLQRQGLELDHDLEQVYLANQNLRFLARNITKNAIPACNGRENQNEDCKTKAVLTMNVNGTISVGQCMNAYSILQTTLIQEKSKLRPLRTHTHACIHSTVIQTTSESKTRCDRSGVITVFSLSFRSNHIKRSNSNLILKKIASFSWTSCITSIYITAMSY